MNYTHNSRFDDFAIPKIIALVDGQSARVYMANPWHTQKIFIRDFCQYNDGIWRLTGGKYITREEATDDYFMRVGKGHIPRDIIENPLNGQSNEYPCDVCATIFSGRTNYFYVLANAYGDYPRKVMYNDS